MIDHRYPGFAVIRLKNSSNFGEMCIRDRRHNGVSAEISLYKNWTKGKKLCYNAS